MKTILLATTTFIEMMRQPAFFFIFFGVGLMIVLTPFFTMFAFYDTNRLLIEMGLASITVMTLVAVSIAASHSIFSEIKRKTALLILTKPVSRFSFLLGKYLGVVFCGLTLIFFHGILLMIVIRMGAPDTAAYIIDQPGVFACVCIFGLSLFYGFFQNYFNRKNFYSYSILGAIICGVVLFAFIGLFGRKWEIEGYWKSFSFELLKGIVLICFAMLVISALSVMFSAYLNKDANLIVTFSFFVLGLLSDRFFGAQQNSNLIYETLYRIVPNFHVFLVSDTIVFQRYIPISYMYNALFYAIVLMVSIFLLALVVFERKEVS